MKAWELAALIAVMVAGPFMGYQMGYRNGMLMVAGSEANLELIGMLACEQEVAQAMREHPGDRVFSTKGGRCNTIMKMLEGR